MAVVGLVFGSAFPFEGNWNYSWGSGCRNALHASALDTLSRLKGIETNAVGIRILILFTTFGYAFPFEGNWNLFSAFIAKCVRLFGYAFPFEGNWNFKLDAQTARRNGRVNLLPIEMGETTFAPIQFLCWRGFWLRLFCVSSPLSQ